MTVDEFEVIRLLDDDGLTQQACASRMNTARTMATAIYDSARKKVADALVNGKRLLITGGHCEYESVEIDQEIIEKGTQTTMVIITTMIALTITVTTGIHIVGNRNKNGEFR